MKPGLSLRISQHLALTPQLQQSIRLLQLSTLELAQEVEQMLDDNPFLEVETEAAPREEFGLAQADTPVAEAAITGEVDFARDLIAGSADAESRKADVATESAEADVPVAEGPSDWDGDGSTDVAPDDPEWGTDAAARGAGTGADGEFDPLDLARRHETLAEHLHLQALALRLGPADTAALRFLIESLNEDGYLEESLEDLARNVQPDADLETLEQLVHHFTVALRLLQSLEPVGVGARSLAECLGMQLREWPDPVDADVLACAEAICAESLDLLARRDIKRLAQRSGSSEACVKSALAVIARLEPRPGRRFVEVERNIIQPDVIVSEVRGSSPLRFQVRLNPDVMPRLRVHDVYAGVLRQNRGGEHQGLSQRLQEARWFIKNIQQRFDTILRVSTAIVERQKSFFVHGELAMRPLVLREIADELGLHESTISRVTTAKYMATPRGTFELKYFFGSGLGTDTGGNASSTAVRALIRQFVAAENPAKPLSDSQLSDMLREQGIECARRTVAKYREALKIAPANLRKTL